MKLFQYSTTSSLKKKIPQPQIISLFLSLLIPAEVIYIFFFLKANIKHIQDQTVR